MHSINASDVKTNCGTKDQIKNIEDFENSNSSFDQLWITKGQVIKDSDVTNRHRLQGELIIKMYFKRNVNAIFYMSRELKIGDEEDTPSPASSKETYSASE